MIQQQQPSAKVDYLLLDLADLNSVRGAANKWLDSGKQIEVLLNNAGKHCTAHLGKELAVVMALLHKNEFLMINKSFAAYTVPCNAPCA